MIGWVTSISDVCANTLGVVFGAVYTTPFVGQLVAYLAATPLIVEFGARTTFVISGAGVLLVLAWTAIRLRGPVRTDPDQ